jgi:hypothetical protein
VALLSGAGGAVAPEQEHHQRASGHGVDRSEGVGLGGEGEGPPLPVAVTWPPCRRRAPSVLRARWQCA